MNHKGKPTPLTTNEELDKILYELQSNAATDDLSNDWEGQLAEAKQAIQALIDQQTKEARIDELKKIDDVCDVDTYFMGRQSAYDYIKARIATLTSDKQGEVGL